MNKLLELEKLIGNTPTIKIKYKFKNKIKYIYAKLEWYNLTGSTKDRVALSIIKNAYLNNTLHKSQPIIETTSGNMGISFSAIGKYLGHPVTIFMPRAMSTERKQLIKLYGANLILCDSFADCFKMAKSYAETNNGYLTLQFDNPYNLLAHYTSTAVEIENKIKNPTCFVAGVGTSGTLMGVSKYLKEHYNSKSIAVEPKSSLLLSSGKSFGKHKLQGLADDIIPSIYNTNLVDQIISIEDNDAIAMAQKLCSELGLGVGISSGANFLGSVLCEVNNAITIFTDDNKKYISTDLTTTVTSDLVNSIKLISYKVI